MSFDLAWDYNTGDLLMAPNHDIAGRTGPSVFEQRIHARLRITRETWDLDPTNGELGGRMLELARMPSPSALASVGQYVREALAPMDDIQVQDVQANYDPETRKGLQVTILYVPLLEEGEAPPDPVQFLVTVATPST